MTLCAYSQSLLPVSYDMFYGKSAADLVDMAKVLAPDTHFKFLEESTNGSPRDYLARYTEAKLHMEATERA